MKRGEFQVLAEKPDKRTPHRRMLITYTLQELGHVQIVPSMVESRVLATSACPKCGHDKITRRGSASGLQHCQCAACKFTFNALTGTPLARLQHNVCCSSDGCARSQWPKRTKYLSLDRWWAKNEACS
jgi:ribosomal protein L37AE/L43A